RRAIAAGRRESCRGCGPARRSGASASRSAAGTRCPDAIAARPAADTRRSDDTGSATEAESLSTGAPQQDFGVLEVRGTADIDRLLRVHPEWPRSLAVKRPPLD